MTTVAEYLQAIEATGKREKLASVYKAFCDATQSHMTYREFRAAVPSIYRVCRYGSGGTLHILGVSLLQFDPRADDPFDPFLCFDTPESKPKYFLGDDDEPIQRCRFSDIYEDFILSRPFCERVGKGYVKELLKIEGYKLQRSGGTLWIKNQTRTGYTILTNDVPFLRKEGSNVPVAEVLERFPDACLDNYCVMDGKVIDVVLPDEYPFFYAPGCCVPFIDAYRRHVRNTGTRINQQEFRELLDSAFVCYPIGAWCGTWSIGNASFAYKETDFFMGQDGRKLKKVVYDSD